MAIGIVVDHKESGVSYAISENHFDEKVHVKIRDLKPGETVLGFIPFRTGETSSVTTEAEQYSGKEWTVEDLQNEIDYRNGYLEDGDKIVPDSNKKADLTAALMLDDETLAEAEVGNSTPE